MIDASLEEMCRRGVEFYERGDAFGGSGNLSLRIEDVIYVTPTGSALKDLDPSRLARVSMDGLTLGSNRPSKEYPFHLEIYRNRPDVRAVVHLHSPHSVAVCCLADLDENEPIPPITPYFVMRVAPLGLVAYHPPGSDALANAVAEKAATRDCMLLRNHGLICAGSSISEAADRAVELEETCRAYLLLRGSRMRTLSQDDVDKLRTRFPGKSA